jgi:16S rRNA (adenine1518-N6/adenine1519-N6)-dimethyltransferase
VSLGETRQLLREFNIRPKKRLGQNFLVSDTLLRAITSAAEIDKKDTILEIGAGLGTLTRALAEQAQRVIALEIDERFLLPLRKVLQDYPNVEIVQGDILKIDLAQLLAGPGEAPKEVNYKVVSNLPYYTTSHLLRHLLESPLKPQLLVVTVQREVAERLVATPGQMSILSVSVQFYGRPRIVARASARAFYPSPKVASAVVRIDVYEEPPAEVDDVEAFFSLVRAGFAQRRKYLKNSLSSGLGLPADQVTSALRQARIEETLRPQALSVEDWARLYGELAAG